MMMRCILLMILSVWAVQAYSWGFYAHRMINYYAVFLLPPEMLVLYKSHISYLSEHAVDPDKRRYAMTGEGPRHYIDLDRYGSTPFDSMPRTWEAAVEKYGEDSLQAHGIVPWWIQTMLYRLTEAFKEKDQLRILKLSAEIGHYLSDAHVPLHTSSNHNGQFTGQRGIHGFWESRIPELFADKEWDFVIGQAVYIKKPLDFTWARILESAAAADSVLCFDRELASRFAADRKYAYEDRNGTMVKQYSAAYSSEYNSLLDNMVERRMRASVYAVASFWYTAWVNAGQPDLGNLGNREFSEAEQQNLDSLNRQWRNGKIKGISCD